MSYSVIDGLVKFMHLNYYLLSFCNDVFIISIGFIALGQLVSLVVLFTVYFYVFLLNLLSHQI